MNFEISYNNSNDEINFEKYGTEIPLLEHLHFCTLSIFQRSNINILKSNINRQGWSWKI